MARVVHAVEAVGMQMPAAERGVRAGGFAELVCVAALSFRAAVNGA